MDHKRLFLLAGIQLLCFSLFAQSPVWLDADTASRSGNITSSDYTIDDDGNQYFCGSFTGVARFGSYKLTASSSTGSDAFITKTDKNGNTIWAKSYSGNGATALNLVVDTAGNVYIAGNFFNSISINGNTVNSAGSTDGYLVKHDKDGDFEWSRFAAGSRQDQSTVLFVDQDNNVYWGGNYISSIKVGGVSLSSSSFTYNCFLAKLKPTGHTSWAIDFGGSSVDQLKAGSHDGNRSILLAGQFFSSFSIGNRSASGIGSYDVFIARIDTAGSAAWALSGGGNNVDDVTSIAWAEKGAFVLTGTFTSSASFGGNSLSGSWQEMYVARYDAQAKGEWATAIPKDGTGFSSGNRTADVASDGEGGAVAVGHYVEDLKRGNNTIDHIGGQDVFVAHINDRGVFDWINTAGGNSNETPAGMVMLGNGKYQIGGICGRSAKFNNNLSINGDVNTNLFWASGVPPTTVPNFKGKKNAFVYVDSTFERSYDLKIAAETTYELLKAPPSLQYDSATVTFKWSPSAEQLGRNQVYLSATNIGGSDTLDLTIWVINKPDVTITAPKAVCLGESVDIGIDDNDAGPLSSLWWFSDGAEFIRRNVNYTFKDTGLYELGLRVGNVFGATDTTWTTVRILPPPKPAFTFSDACVNDSLKLSNTSSVAFGNITDYAWYENDSFVANTEHYKRLNAKADSVDFKLKLTSNGGCVDSITRTLRITEAPKVRFSSFNTCEREEALFFDQTTISQDTIIEYKWDFDDGNTSTVSSSGVAHTYAQRGTYKPTLTIYTSNNCVGMYSDNIVVYGKPDLDFTNTEVCGTSPVKFTNASKPVNGTITARIWNFGDGKFSSANNPSHSYNKAGVYDVSLISSNSRGCSDTLTKTIYINSIPKPQINVPKVCGNGFSTLQSSVGLSSFDTIDTYSWTIDGLPQGNRAFTTYRFGDTQQVYDIKLKVVTKAECADSVTQQVQPEPVVPSAFSVPLACVGDTVTLQTQLNARLDSVFWIPLGMEVWREGLTLKAKIEDEVDHHLFLRTFADNGCEDSSFNEVDVKALPNSNFTWESSQTSVDFTAADNSLDSYTWSFGDGNSSSNQNPVHQYDTFGTYTVSLTTTNDAGCAFTTEEQITLNRTVSIGGSLQEMVSVYPNPAKDYLFVALPAETIADITIVDLSGKKLFTQRGVVGQQQLSISSLPVGAYILHVQMAEGSAQYRIMVQ